MRIYLIANHNSSTSREAYLGFKIATFSILLYKRSLEYIKSEPEKMITVPCISKVHGDIVLAEEFEEGLLLYLIVQLPAELGTARNIAC